MDRVEFKRGFDKFVKVYPKKFEEGALDTYFDRFKWVDAEQWLRVTDKVIDKAKRFPVPADIWEVINEMGFHEKVAKMGDPFVHLDCECKNSFAVSRKNIVESPDHFKVACPGQFYGVCERFWTVSELKEAL